MLTLSLGLLVGIKWGNRCEGAFKVLNRRSPLSPQINSISGGGALTDIGPLKLPKELQGRHRMAEKHNTKSFVGLFEIVFVEPFSIPTTVLGELDKAENETDGLCPQS